MFDVGDLPVLTFGKIFSVLKTGVIKWPLKLYGLFYVFNVFFKIPKHHFLCFLSCCTRFLEHWHEVIERLTHRCN